MVLINIKMVRVYSLEGNIGSGKSTMFLELQRLFKQNKKICFLDEPIDEWNTIKDSQQETILSKFYRDQKKYAFSFQMMAYISRLSLLKKALRKNYDVIITERSVYTDQNIFAKMLYDSGMIEEINYQIYLRWFMDFVTEIPTIHYIYIRVQPKTAYNRVVKRARKGENIRLDYLQKCHQYHEAWISKIKDTKCIINADGDIQNNPKIMQEWIATVRAFVMC